VGDIQPGRISLALDKLFPVSIPLHGLTMVVGQVHQVTDGDGTRPDFNIGYGPCSVAHAIQEILLVI